MMNTTTTTPIDELALYGGDDLAYHRRSEATREHAIMSVKYGHTYNAHALVTHGIITAKEAIIAALRYGQADVADYIIKHSNIHPSLDDDIYKAANEKIMDGYMSIYDVIYDGGEMKNNNSRREDLLMDMIIRDQCSSVNHDSWGPFARGIYVNKAAVYAVNEEDHWLLEELMKNGRIDGSAICDELSDEDKKVYVKMIDSIVDRVDY